ncbi:MAG: PH domain-containing protein [Deltaproteobacteria bacterium]|nr:MAG: PH domain-containing protein [Deltaproteobacteria bacterium]
MKSKSPEQPIIPHQEDALGLPLDREAIFSNHKGVYKKGIEKRQTRLLKKIAFLKNFLKEDERILLITTGCSPTSIWEQFLTGWIFIYLKRSLFVFTNKRIFHIPTKIFYSYRNSIAQILYPDCNSIQIKGRKLILEYENGKKDKFLYIARKEKKKIKALLPTISFEGSPSESQKRIHLCPRCTQELREGKYICANCHLDFKGKDEGKKISLIYPGGGYFYTRHPFLGIGDAIVETILLVLVIVSLIDAVKGVEGSGGELFAFAIVLVIEKAISVYHSNHFIKDYIPKEKDIQSIA